MMMSDFLAGALPLVLVWMAFYGLVVWPDARERAERRAMVRRLRVGDAVITTLGLRGVIRDLDESRRFVEVEIAEGVVCSMSSYSIERILPPLASAEGEAVSDPAKEAGGSALG